MVTLSGPPTQLAIGDLATQYFADRDIFCAGRVPEQDLLRTLQAVGGAMQTSVNGLLPTHLGQCALFEEKQIGGERCAGLLIRASSRPQSARERVFRS